MNPHFKEGTNVMKTIYMFLVRICSLMYAGQKKSQVAYLMSFSNNQDFILKLADRISPLPLYVFYEVSGQADLGNLKNHPAIKLIPFNNGLALFLKVIPILMRSKLIVVDNYFPVLGAIIKTKQMRITQLWHANGAIKAFGFSDPSTERRGKAAQLRFQRVYDSFDDIIVGSQKMADAFQINYRLDGHQTRLLGYPRSDKFKNKDWIAQAREKFYRYYPALRGKQLILYTPTYRKGISFAFAPGFEKLKLPQNAVFILRLHPHLQQLEKAWEQKVPFVTSIRSDITTDELLTVADTLITDYSSILFDYTLLDNAHQVGLFAFDQSQFEKTVGLQRDFSEDFDKILIKDVPELSEFLAQPAPQQMVMSQLNEQWNTFNDGHATKRTLDFLMKRSGN